MKNRMIYTAIAAGLLITSASAQEVKFGEGDNNSLSKTKITIGTRVSMDGAYFMDDVTPLKSGATIPDARIRMTIQHGKWDAYFDADFGKGVYTQKNVFLRYNFSEKNSLRVGYATESFSISSLTSQSDLHFITRSAAVNALAPGRNLGITYKHRGNSFFTETGIYSENMYNKQEVGDQGFAASGCYLYVPVNNDNLAIHVGAVARFKKIETGVVEGNPGVFTKYYHINSGLETNVDPSVKFLDANVQWADKEFKYGAEFLAVTPRFFAQGEYIGSRIDRSRPDKLLFENQLGSQWSWTTLKGWQDGNPELTPLNFNGAYLELGYLLSGNAAYKYDTDNALLKALSGDNLLEIVGRYSYTSLNDVKNGDIYWKAQDKFFPASKGIIDYPASSPSIGGGKLQTFTLGLNYNFTSNVRAMLHYTLSKVDSYKFDDENISMLQLRVQFKF